MDKCNKMREVIGPFRNRKGSKKEQKPRIYKNVNKLLKRSQKGLSAFESKIFLIKTKLKEQE